jgi:hypothetical protein
LSAVGSGTSLTLWALSEIEEFRVMAFRHTHILGRCQGKMDVVESPLDEIAPNCASNEYRKHRIQWMGNRVSLSKITLSDLSDHDQLALVSSENMRLRKHHSEKLLDLAQDIEQLRNLEADQV